MTGPEDLSPAKYGVKCDGQVLPVMGHRDNGDYLGTAVVSGTDDTSAIERWLRAVAVGAGHENGRVLNQVGASVEGGANPVYQGRAALPAGRHCLVTSFPNVPAGIVLDGAGAEIDVTTAAGNGPSFVSLQEQGKYYVGSAGGTPVTNGIYSRSNDIVSGLRIVYAGPLGQSTGIGLRVSNALNESIVNNNVYGFKTCIQLEALEYSNFDRNQAGNCGTGFKLTTGYTTVGGPSAPGGGISIDLQGYGNVSRLNDVNWWFNGAVAVRLFGGTGAFARKANIIFGGAPPDYVDRLTLSGVRPGSYAASKTYPLTFSDPGGGTGFEGILRTDAGGTPVAAYSVSGGRGMTAATVVKAPVCTTAGCATPIISPHIATFKGMGDYDGSSASGLNLIDGMDLESEGCAKGCAAPEDGPTGRPSSGFQVIAEPGEGGSTLQHMLNFIGGTPQEFARFALDLGGNIFEENQYGAVTDPVTGLVCSLMHGTTGRTQLKLRDAGVSPAQAACVFNGGYDAGSAYLAVSGFQDEIPKSPGQIYYSPSSATAPFARPVRIEVDGEPRPRFEQDGNGGLHWGPGGSAGPDTALVRSGAGVLSTTGLNVGALQLLIATPENYHAYPAQIMLGGGPVRGALYADGQFLHFVSPVTRHELKIPWQQNGDDTAAAAGVAVDKGIATLVGGRATVNGTVSRSGSVVLASNCGAKGTPGVVSAVAGAGTIAISSTSAGDNSRICWAIQ